MTIRVALNHVTEYRYDRPVTMLPHVVRLRPAPHCRTPILSYSMTVLPKPHFLNWQQDPYSNYLGRLVFPQPVRTFRVAVDLIAEMTTINPFDFFLEQSAETYPFVYEPELAKELAPFLEIEPAGPHLEALTAESRRRDVRTIDFIVEINRRVQEMIRYLIRMEPGIQGCEETLTLRSGSCRDSAWLLVQLARRLGLAARFVSGYLIQLTADQPALDGPSGPSSDFTDLHAWTEVYLPGAGWVGLDPTSGLLAGEGHIPLACAAHPVNAAPVTGSFSWDDGEEPPGTAFDFKLSVARVLEQPRVTKPYTEEQWEEIDALGRRIDGELEAADVRLTMGGEPTFVSIDHRDAPEWNTTSLGPDKRLKAGVLLRRIRDRFGPGGLLHFGQGKWYPGESLPRWAFGCYWRTDGEPIWADPKLVADDTWNYGYGSSQAGRFMEALALRLGVDPLLGIPGYEDVWYAMWKERCLPVNVDPLDNKLDNPEDRARLTRVFDRGLKTVVGYALPIRRAWGANGPFWQSGRWFLRREHLFLIPGDSPMGYRLPLDSLPWQPAESIDQVYEPDPFATSPPLPTRDTSRQRSFPGSYPGWGPASLSSGPAGAWPWFNGQGTPGNPAGMGAPGGPGGRGVPGDPVSPAAFGTPWGFDQTPVSGQPWYGVVRTAMCVEPRDGRLHVFMPPLGTAADYLDLVAAVEATAAETGFPVLIEGYPPPYDARLRVIKVTPDPGVIEVNIHPSRNWAELSETTTALYEEARLSRLTTEKFMHDGRHVGTGGGNHVVLGGLTPADSPLLRRPDVLRSLISVWHNHPSLSYLFSGMFVGPTSQAPRVDEARNDSLYELELAFRQLPGHTAVPPWLVDRALRHLLIDVTGNTHRTEFCIDKLYSPDSASGRLGLLELRSFEMPPHARMSLAQQLLVRAMLARAWDQPYPHPLVRWGTGIHDRFMLPHFVWQDFQDVIADLRRSGYPVREEWFAPHLEFRFPKVGSVAYRGVTLELRHAIEPWHVLGEEVVASGTARYVDSSVERLQVLVNGMTAGRHVVTCNGRPLPLHPTGVVGEFVAGVRYRAWQPPSCLHPTIPVHSPLLVEIVDRWSGRSLGGCTFHVSHPGGRAHDNMPINAAEAEGRRLARFVPFGHTPGPVVVADEPRGAEHPLTLDLRQPARSVGGPSHPTPDAAGTQGRFVGTSESFPRSHGIFHESPSTDRRPADALLRP